MSSEMYAGYVQWKGWESDFTVSEWHRRYFDGEFARYHFRRMRVLEIGFGEGMFLAYATLRGATVVGTEAIPELVHEGVRHGFDVYAAHEFNWDDHKDEFDLVVALDVIEHLDFMTIRDYLRRIADCLTPNGELFLRFPNGQSPFSLVFQNADATHHRPLSAPLMRQLADGTGLHVIEARNQHIKSRGSNLFKTAALLCYVGLRRLGHRLISVLFLEGPNAKQRTLLEQNVVVVLGRKSEH